MLVGVSTRRYARSLEPVPDDLAARGTSRSAVSRRFVAATDRQMAEWLGRDLGAIDLVVLMIDGVVINEHVLLVALGIDIDGAPAARVLPAARRHMFGRQPAAMS